MLRWFVFILYLLYLRSCLLFQCTSFWKSWPEAQLINVLNESIHLIHYSQENKPEGVSPILLQSSDQNFEGWRMGNVNTPPCTVFCFKPTWPFLALSRLWINGIAEAGPRGWWPLAAEWRFLPSPLWGGVTAFTSGIQQTWQKLATHGAIFRVEGCTFGREGTQCKCRG